MSARATVIGAGLAGLSAAVRLRRAGVAVAISDSAAQAGGRCRSYHDPQLGLTIDNGNHLVLSGNRAVAEFRAAVGAAPETLTGPDEAAFAFADLSADLEDGARWTVRINRGRLGWWVAVPGRRVPGSRMIEYLALARLAGAGPDETIADRIATTGPVWERLLRPVLLAALNTDPGPSSARLAWAVLRETIGRGGAAMRPLVAHPTLAAAFVDPASAWLEAQGSAVRLNRRLRAIRFEGEHVAALEWSDGVQVVDPDEAVVLALPPWVAADLVPGLPAPKEMRAIVNAHFAFPARPDMPPMLGLLGTKAEWLFAFPDRISVTVSAAEHLVDQDRETLARTFWGEIGRAYGIEAPLPAWQIVKEKRATFAATPEQDRLRPGAATRWRNLFLAGDWTQTGLPSTIEGALRSGEVAARLAAGAARR
ncbi:NAD(P)-binding protein [Sphingomonas sp. AP4-R1]|uniref:hydroxysqualene dehydroxylase HpnE n=1 Tax=Sphingomonas sp. AP4-R1 TaxID=2735134 RepID=UPI0014939BFB|nr:hydroxysqualene dehydroxylase HpnE [Sphingomonas sp. AP4-R1]QJU57514.1 NAD(P)-binding protein [Sphingomonas sp. AP4-R1]